jgi:uncharacterized protein (TIGR02266 family)
MHTENSRHMSAGCGHTAQEGWPMVRERRTLPRIETSLEITYKKSGVFMFAYMPNLNSGGLFIKTDHFLPVDTELEMSIQLPNETDIMHIGGRVVWTKVKSHAFPAGMGIQFIGIPSEYKEKIQSFVKNRSWKGNVKQFSERAVALPEQTHRPEACAGLCHGSGS